MFDVVLYEPEIPPNTGNVIRLAANTGVRLHVVHPLGFSLRDRQLRRAGLDYHDSASVTPHMDWANCHNFFAGRRMFAVTTRATQRYDQPRYREDDVFLFGPETRGLPASVLSGFSSDQQIRLPMRVGKRSLNLSNAVAVIVYEAWRQLRFAQGI